ncbi:hypothetical protein SNE35_29675 [Paucibacter sp. R3-3]|uniref:Rad50/SbcC-type AAA domain-containing protein n=1 Tax=Roseateles agri TaxID=3098619 RepID=A0ABU5DQW2_9BURK|nr:hypothetical protein [Paucibacter sp. R3-3]MDY0748705.1 hypothetical protein [Paucibacter sp. R3-3]
MTSTYAQKIAQRTGRSLDDVRAVLARHHIVDAPTPPVSRQLRLKRLQFSGEKHVHHETVPFKFDWSPQQEGVNVIASDDNLVGKSSILQTMLWAVRGEPKSLTATVQGWIKNVVAEFQAGDRHVRVAFDVEDGVPHGVIELINKDGAVIHSLGFFTAELFKSQMNSVMLDALALDPIATSREVASLEKVVMYADGWAAYTGAFLFDSESSAIIGEHTGTDLAQRLLQVFLGIPWATTLFQARAAKRVTESLVQSRKRRLGQLGDRSVQQLQDRLEEIARQIADGSAQQTALAQLDAAQRRYDELAEKVSQLKATSTVLDAEVLAGNEELNNKKRSLLEIEEEMAASRFFGRLSPTCCPRCTRAFDKSRIDRERTAGDCSVCLTHVEQTEEINCGALKEGLSKEVSKLEKLLRAVATNAGEVKNEFEQARKDLEGAARDVSRLAAGGTAQEEQKLRLEAAKLEGMLEAVSKMVQTDTGEESDLAVLEAATDVAKDQVESEAEAVLERSGELICEMVQRLGMRDVERVVLKRNAGVEIHKGGSLSTFTRLSAGERLRVRIATVIALLQAAQQFGVGRHPGFLIIDSPAKEEMADPNVEELLESLADLPRTVNLQLFAAFRGTQRALKHFQEDHCLLARANQTLW